MIVVPPLMSKRKLYTTGVYQMLFDAGCNRLLKHLLFRQTKIVCREVRIVC